MVLIEPVMILVMGGLVFVILMAIMLPIFELNRAVS
jgi:type II secretory pathway component PulF